MKKVPRATEYDIGGGSSDLGERLSCELDVVVIRIVDIP